MDEQVMDNNVETIDETTENFDVEETSTNGGGLSIGSMLIGTAIGVAGTILVPKAFKGVTKAFKGAKEKVAAKVEEAKTKKLEAASDDHVVIDGGKDANK